MTQRCKAMRLRPCLLAVAMAVALTLDLPSSAADAPSEEARLAALVRQLDMLERLTQQSTEIASVADRRYHFDYSRLHADIERIRGGIQDYLSPLRAQPRDPQELKGDYRRDEDAAP
ncbi:MAG: RAQPRD family integrative conjugative element protein [Gammaproteobacteria bacterium]